MALAVFHLQWCVMETRTVQTALMRHSVQMALALHSACLAVLKVAALLGQKFVILWKTVLEDQMRI